LSKHPANAFKIHVHDVCSMLDVYSMFARRLLDVCWMFARCLLDRVNGVQHRLIANSHLRRRRDSSQQLRRVDVVRVNWA